MFKKSHQFQSGPTSFTLDSYQSDGSTYHLAIHRVEPFDDTRVQLDGVRDVGHDLLEGVRRLLVEQNPHGLTRLHSAAHDGHQLGLDVVPALPALPAIQAHRLGAGEGLRAALGPWGPGANRPVGVDVLGVVQLLVGLDGGAHVALSCIGKRLDCRFRMSRRSSKGLESQESI